MTSSRKTAEIMTTLCDVYLLALAAEPSHHSCQRTSEIRKGYVHASWNKCGCYIKSQHTYFLLSCLECISHRKYRSRSMSTPWKSTRPSRAWPRSSLDSRRATGSSFTSRTGSSSSRESQQQPASRVHILCRFIVRYSRKTRKHINIYPSL